MAVVAMDASRAIGNKGQLPWHLPDDLKWFKKLTMGSPIVMGRATFDSIGRPLRGRRNIVLSRSLAPADAPEGIEVIPSADALDDLGLEGDVYLIGGAAIFEQLMPRCSEVYLSIVDGTHEADTFLPPVEGAFPPPSRIVDFEGFHVLHYQSDAREALGGD